MDLEYVKFCYANKLNIEKIFSVGKVMTYYYQEKPGETPLATPVPDMDDIFVKLSKHSMDNEIRINLRGSTRVAYQEWGWTSSTLQETLLRLLFHTEGITDVK
jgi:hypothetical protein